MTSITAHLGWKELGEGASTPIGSAMSLDGWRSAIASTAMTVREAIEPKWSATIDLVSSCTQETKQDYAAVHYDNISRMIHCFSEMDSDENFYIDYEASKAGELFVSIAKTYNIPPPKVFAHGGDAVVFTWEFVDKIRCLTASSYNVYLQEFEPNGLGGKAKAFDLSKTGDVFNLTRITGGEAWKQVRIQDRSLTKTTPEV